MRRSIGIALTSAMFLGILAPLSSAVTQDEVIKAIDKAKQFLISQQGGNGAWKEQKYWSATGEYGNTEIALYTLAYVGEHPNKDYISRSLDVLMTRPLDYTYAISMRTMALAKLQKVVAEPKKTLIRGSLQLDAMWLVQAQGSHGGWNYTTLNNGAGRYDFSCTQMAILALREAAMAGIEIPEIVWKRSQKLYFDRQRTDGSWNYGDAGNKHIGGDVPGYGTMTAAGLASIFITTDNLDLSSGCPCRAGQSNKTKGDFERRIDLCMTWLEKNFLADGNPKFPDGPGSHKFYWMYAVERVGIAAGYKYFGTHNWYKEGAEALLKSQQPNGSWGTVPDTCFALLFLYKGLAPILFNKLEFKDAYKNVTDKNDWNNHRRDIANLTAWIEKQKEEMFLWQIVSLRAPVDELHDAPVLFITPELPPEFTEENKKKLRAFTDSGGTILLEASCGNPRVKTWAAAFIKEVWPEWTLKPLGSDHGTFVIETKPMKQRPEMMGIDDGLRTCVFYSMDDIGCPWQTKAYTNKEYLFQWGQNLYTYATDRGALRSRLAPREADTKPVRYKEPVKAGERNTLKLTRVKYDGTGWLTGRNYGLLTRLAAEVKSRAGVTLTVDESGIGAAGLGDADIAYLTGSAELKLADTDKAGLKAFADKGGLLVVEAAGGTIAFDQEFRKVMGDMGWEVKPMPATAPLITGKMDPATGYSLISNVQFSRALRVTRLSRPQAELQGIYQGEKLVGLYSPFDVLYSMTPYEAYNKRGYQSDDAKAVATNIILFATARPK